MTQTADRPYQMETLADIGAAIILPHADPLLTNEVVERMATGTASIQQTVGHFLDFHFQAYCKEPTRERRLELLSLMAAYEDIADNT